jgi:D-alanyl-D-alanine endopeptidase (penicillin-binding protein 7)
MKFIIALLLLVSQTAYAQKGAYVLYDYDLDRSQVTHNVDDVRSIASITKLFTAIVVLRSGVELDEKVKVQGKSGGRFPKGMMVSRNNLMRAMLISSDNLAAETLAHTYPGGFDKFILDTNEYARGMGLINTRIVDSSGLLAGNVSTAADLITFLWKIRNNEVIRNIAKERNDHISLPKGKKTITINLQNTNPSLLVFDNILISKTGFTSAAGRCVIMLVEKNKTLHGIVILGQKNVKDRSQIANDLITAKAMEKEQMPEPIVFEFPL